MNKQFDDVRRPRALHSLHRYAPAGARSVLCTAVLGSLAACGSGGTPDGTAGSDESRPIASLGDPAAANPDLDPGQGPGLGTDETFDDGFLTLYEALAIFAGAEVASPRPDVVRPDAPGPTLVAGVPTAGTGDSVGVPSPPAAGSGDDTAGGGPSTAPPTLSAPGMAAANPTAPSASVADEIGDSTLGRRFASRTTPGFEGEVLDDGRVRLEWPSDRTARGYNVYRGAEYVTTVFATEWTDEDTFDGDLYYEIEAFDFVDKFTRIATGLTVPVRGSGRVDPEANLAGTPQLQDYQLVFSDEFEGGSLDLSTWNTSYLWGDDLVINQEEQHYVDVKNEPDFGFDPFEVGDGTLTIKSVPTPPALSAKANGQPYLSGVITSYDAFKFTYGYAEARAKTPYGQGLWSAFWLLNAYYGDDDPEIDIMEHIGDDQDVMYHTYHYYDGDELRSTESHPVPGVDYTGDFHTYAVDWRPGLIVFYVDGKETHRVTDPRVSNQEMYVIANTALGGWWPGSPDGTTAFPARFELDYIRVYQKNGPYDDSPVFNDDTSYVPYADATLGTAPNHRPPFSAWPQGYPTR